MPPKSLLQTVIDEKNKTISDLREQNKTLLETIQKLSSELTFFTSQKKIEAPLPLFVDNEGKVRPMNQEEFNQQQADLKELGIL